MRSLVLALCCIALLAAAGCGGSSKSDKGKAQSSFISACTTRAASIGDKAAVASYCRCAYNQVVGRYGNDAFKENGKFSRSQIQAAAKPCFSELAGPARRAFMGKCTGGGAPQAYCQCAYQRIVARYGYEVFVQIAQGTGPSQDELKNTAFKPCFGKLKR